MLTTHMYLELVNPLFYSQTQPSSSLSRFYRDKASLIVVETPPIAEILAFIAQLCKTKAIEMEDGISIIDKEKCKHYGQCIAVCPSDAIIEKRKGFAVLVGGKCGGECGIHTQRLK